MCCGKSCSLPFYVSIQRTSTINSVSYWHWLAGEGGWEFVTPWQRRRNSTTHPLMCVVIYWILSWYKQSLIMSGTWLKWPRLRWVPRKLEPCMSVIPWNVETEVSQQRNVAMKNAQWDWHIPFCHSTLPTWQHPLCRGMVWGEYPPPLQSGTSWDAIALRWM